MADAPSIPPGRHARARATLASLLRDRQPEIEQAIWVRVRGISEVNESGNLMYLQGFREAIPAAVSYGIAAVEFGELGTPTIPVTLTAQARLAARSGIALPTVLRRYVAGQTLFGDFIYNEAEQSGLEARSCDSCFRRRHLCLTASSSQLAKNTVESRVIA